MTHPSLAAVFDRLDPDTQALLRGEMPPARCLRCGTVVVTNGSWMVCPKCKTPAVKEDA